MLVCEQGFRLGELEGGKKSRGEDEGNREQGKWANEGGLFPLPNEYPFLLIDFPVTLGKVIKAAFTLSARVRDSLGTNVNTPFFQVPMLEFGHGAGARGTSFLCAHRFC